MKLFSAFSAFSDVPATRLGWLRVVVGIYVLIHMGGRLGLYARIADSPPNMFRPLGITNLLSGAMPPDVFMWLVALCMGLGALFVLGWRTRVVAPMFAVLLLFCMTYRTSWVQIYHSDNLMVLQVIALSLAPGLGDAVSLDARAGRGRDRPSWEYAWPIALACTVTAITYFIAGAAKVAGSAGWSWAVGTNLRDQIAYNAINKELLGGAPDKAARWAFQHPLLLVPGSLMSLFAELGAPLALLHKRLGWLWAVAAIGMHWGIFVLMGIGFDYPLYGIAFACFFPIERPLNWLVALLPSPK